MMQTLGDFFSAGATTQLSLFGAVPRLYTPDSGDARLIDALVTWEDDTASPVAGSRSRGTALRVTVKNDSGTGIAADEFTQADVIAVPPRPGAAVREFRLTKIVNQSEALITFEVH